MAKIFVRERRDVGKGDERPRFAVIGIQGSDLKFFKSRVRRAELEAIAQASGAELVYLPQGNGDNDGAGKERKRRRKQADA